jgi:hypothetical protein
MKPLITILSLSLLVSVAASGQSLRGIDKSPVDIAYLPDNFAHDRKFAPERNLPENAVIRVIYGRPQMKGREVFGNLVPYGKVWRTGANEATEIKLNQDVKFAGETLKTGTYALFTIPGEEEWTIIFNSDLDHWGAYSYNEEYDVLRVTAKAETSEEQVEAFSIQFTDAAMILAWDKTIVEVPVGY